MYFSRTLAADEWNDEGDEIKNWFVDRFIRAQTDKIRMSAEPVVSFR